MTSVDDILYAPVKPKMYDIYYNGTPSAYSKGPLPYEEAIKVRDHLLATNGAGYTLHELEWGVQSSSSRPKDEILY